MRNRMLVIGSGAIEALHQEGGTVEIAGGAGTYVALAASRCGARVSLFGLRPDPCPEPLQPVVEHLVKGLGPVVPPAELLPHFEISHRGGKTEHLNASQGAKARLSPAMLPADLSQYDLVHVTAQSDVALQLAFLEACRQRGAVHISVGTCSETAMEDPQAVRALMEQADYFFMTDLEAEAVFGSLEAAHMEPGQVLFVTLGTQGVRVVQGRIITPVPAVPATAIEPEGADDAFCGAALAYMLQKQHPIMAARRALALTAELVRQGGPAALLSEDPPPEVPLDARVRVNEGQVRRVARTIYTLVEASPFPFVAPELPPVGHPAVLDYFFAATLQQFSFWSTRDNRYDQPLIAPIGGVERKGSDYLWAAFTRRLEVDADFCSPKRQAMLSQEELLEVFRADDGEEAMPALDLHLEQARRYGRDMLALQLTPQAVLDRALASPQPLQTFLVTLDHVGGYGEDPLRKKSLLLGMILRDRPEGFLPLRDDEQIAPIMDYHFMRSCLRIGLIDVLDGELRTRLVNREIVSPAEEWAVRYPAYLAIEELVTLSGRGLGAVNALLFTNARKRCPEMTEPQCRSCVLDGECAHRKEYFQPVLRTTFY